MPQREPIDIHQLAFLHYNSIGESATGVTRNVETRRLENYGSLTFILFETVRHS